MRSFIIAEYLRQILGGGGFGLFGSPPHPPLAASKIPILNRVKEILTSMTVFLQIGMKLP